jgi:hypothetical protein
MPLRSALTGAFMMKDFGSSLGEIASQICGFLLL